MLSSNLKLSCVSWYSVPFVSKKIWPRGGFHWIFLIFQKSNLFSSSSQRIEFKACFIRTRRFPDFSFEDSILIILISKAKLDEIFAIVLASWNLTQFKVWFAKVKNSPLSHLELHNTFSKILKIRILKLSQKKMPFFKERKQHFPSKKNSK